MRRELRAVLWATGLIAAALFALWAICVRMPGSSFAGPLPPADAALKLAASRLRADVQQLASNIGERNLDRPQALSASANWLFAELERAGHSPARRGYDAGGLHYENIEAELAGTSLPQELVVVGAHYDSAAGAPGANDNGSGVAATLALARRLSGKRSGRTLRFVFFVNEEPPHFQTDAMGSLVAARASRAAGENVVAMLSLETLGYFSDAPGSQRYPFPLTWFYPERGDFVAFVGDLASRSLVERSLAAFRAHESFPSEGGCLPRGVPGVGWSDHWAYWQQGFPALMVTDTALFRYPHYHRLSDTPNQLDYDRLARVVRGLERVLSALTRAP
jgi:hypothetical protein